MNPVRWIFPLELRQRIAYRLVVANSTYWPGDGRRPHTLALAPTSLASLCRTDVAHRCIAWMGFYELELSRRMAAIGREPGGLMVDVGANAGYFSCMWASLSPKNRCLAFEASPCVAEMLRANVTTAGFEQSIEVFDFALGRMNGVMDFDPGPIDQTGWGGLVPSPTGASVAVEVKRLDQIVPKDVEVNVLKIDTEGADAWVLEGAECLLKERRIRHVFFECNRPRMEQLGIAPNAAQDLLSSFGYDVKSLGDSKTSTEFVATAIL